MRVTANKSDFQAGVYTFPVDTVERRPSSIDAIQNMTITFEPSLSPDHVLFIQNGVRLNNLLDIQVADDGKITVNESLPLATLTPLQLGIGPRELEKLKNISFDVVSVKVPRWAWSYDMSTGKHVFKAKFPLNQPTETLQNFMVMKRIAGRGDECMPMRVYEGDVVGDASAYSFK